MATIFFRSSSATADELSVALKYFPVSESRILRDEIVIARYSALPFYKELERDLKLQGSRLLNSYSEHQYIAEFEWYWDVEEFTPKSWFNWRDVPDNQGPYVVKGRTNSHKFQWNKKMYAETYEDLKRVHLALLDDELLSQQGLVYRKYVPLKTYEIGVGGLPFTNEWRFFYYKDKLLSYGYYWIISEYTGDMNDEGLTFAQKIATVIAEQTNFFVLDIAQTVTGEWILIEVNDGQQSGLSGNDPEVLYSSLKAVLLS